MEARDIKFGTGAHDRSSRTVSTTQEKSQPGDLGERQHDSDKDAEKEQALMTKIAILWRELDLMIKQSEN